MGGRVNALNKELPLLLEAWVSDLCCCVGNLVDLSPWSCLHPSAWGCVCVCVHARGQLSKYQNIPSNYKLVPLVPCPHPPLFTFFWLKCCSFRKAPVFVAQPIPDHSNGCLCFSDSWLWAAECFFISYKWAQSQRRAFESSFLKCTHVYCLEVQAYPRDSCVALRSTEWPSHLPCFWGVVHFSMWKERLLLILCDSYSSSSSMGTESQGLVLGVRVRVRKRDDSLPFCVHVIYLYFVVVFGL